MQEAKRHCVQDLLRAGVEVPKTIEIFEVSQATVFRVKKGLDEGNDLSHKSRSSPVNKKLTASKLDDIRQAFEASPTTSLRKMAKSMEMSHTSMRKAISDPLMVSRVRPHQQLLTTKQKEARVSRCLGLIN